MRLRLVRPLGLLRGALLRCALLLTLACGLSPRGYCDSIAETTCTRIFACTTGEAERWALRSVYADEAACTKALKARSLCETHRARERLGVRRRASQRPVRAVGHLPAELCATLPLSGAVWVEVIRITSA